MNRMLAGLVVAASVLVCACEDKPSGGGPAASASASAASTGTTAPTASAAATVAPTASAVATASAAPASAAAAFPATALTAKKLADYTIGLPPGGKIDKTGDDKASVETPDYKVMIKLAGKDTIADMKPMIQKLPGFKSLVVDQADGIVAEFEDKGAKQYMFTRYTKVGDVTISCENALTKPAKDLAKAKEAFDVCGTVKKK